MSLRHIHYLFLFHISNLFLFFAFSYKPEQQASGGGLTEASVNLLSPSKGQSNGGGGGVNEKIALQQYPPPKSSEAQLIDFTSKTPGGFDFLVLRFQYDLGMGVYKG